MIWLPADRTRDSISVRWILKLFVGVPRAIFDHSVRRRKHDGGLVEATKDPLSAFGCQKLVSLEQLRPPLHEAHRLHVGKLVLGAMITKIDAEIEVAHPQYVIEPVQKLDAEALRDVPRTLSRSIVVVVCESCHRSTRSERGKSFAYLSIILFPPFSVRSARIKVGVYECNGSSVKKKVMPIATAPLLPTTEAMPHALESWVTLLTKAMRHFRTATIMCISYIDATSTTVYASLPTLPPSRTASIPLSHASRCLTAHSCNPIAMISWARSLLSVPAGRSHPRRTVSVGTTVSPKFHVVAKMLNRAEPAKIRIIAFSCSTPALASRSDLRNSIAHAPSLLSVRMRSGEETRAFSAPASIYCPDTADKSFPRSYAGKHQIVGLFARDVVALQVSVETRTSFFMCGVESSKARRSVKLASQRKPPLWLPVRSAASSALLSASRITSMRFIQMQPHDQLCYPSRRARCG